MLEVRKKQRTGRNRLSMDIPQELFKEIRLMTVKHNCTITKWILKAIIEQLAKERSYDQLHP